MKFFTAIALILLTIITAACGPGDERELPTLEGAYDIHPKLREYYNQLGGQEILGPAISEAQTKGSELFQYTTAALMTFDQNAQPKNRFKLAPIGVEMGIKEPKVPGPAIPGERYVGGHIIYPDFQPLYEKLGAANVGRPLTEVHYNPEKKRFEQYFENVGFYRMEGDPPSKSHLLAYGAWKCNSHCRSSALPNSLIVIQPEVESPFSDAMARLGSDFTGFSLTKAYVAQDGRLEQIFENVVLSVDRSHSKKVTLRPITERVGILHEQLATRSDEEGAFFYAVAGDKGYNIPGYFMDYIKDRGGMDVTGPPITEASQQQSQAIQQCFENVCLEREVNGYIHPAPLGYSYKQIFYRQTDQKDQSGQPATQHEIALQAWASQQMVSSDQAQKIGVSVEEDGNPLAKVVPVLVLTLPDGSQKRYEMPPTGEDGKSHISVPPISAPNSTLIPYQVCISDQNGENYCFKDSYLIWNKP